MEDLGRWIDEIPPTDEKEEEELSQRIRQGDRKSIERLVEGNLCHILPIAVAMAGKRNGNWDARDLLQEGALAMAEGAQRWEWTGKPFRYYGRMRARGAMRDFLRRRADVVRGAAAVSIHTEGEDGEQWQLAITENPRLAQIALDRLPRPIGRIVERMIFANPRLSVEKTAEELGIEPRTVRQRWRRAIPLLRQAVRESA